MEIEYSELHPCYYLLHFLHTQFNIVYNGFEEGDRNASDALVFPPNEDLFRSSSVIFEQMDEYTTGAQPVCSVVSNMLKAYKFHCDGEVNYYDGNYSEAYNNFLAAAEYVENALKNVAILESLNASWLLPSVVSYKYFYYIEAYEALSFQSVKQEKWTEAIEYYKKDLEITVQVLDIIEPYTVSLKKRLKGHYWFAKRGYYDCMARISDISGDVDGKNEYLLLAKEANKKSLSENPAFESHNDARENILKKLKDLNLPEEEINKILNTTWIDEGELKRIFQINKPK